MQQQVSQRGGGKLRTVIGRSIGFDDIPTALCDIENRRTHGKIVVTMPG